MSALLAGSAIVTGAGSGLGQATSVAFARHGIQKLALIDLNSTGMQITEELIRKAVGDQTELLSIEADISDEASVIGAMKSAAKKFGRIDIAINNAGVGGPIKPSTETSLEEYRKVIDINTIGLWLCQREELKQMLSQDPIQVRPGIQSRGVIVNVASIFGLTGSAPWTPATPYSTSKHGVIAITKNDANTYAKEGIRINAICPGFVKSDSLEAAVSTSDIMRKELNKIPMDRLASTEEIAEAIVFLASSMSSFMTGSSLVVDGSVALSAKLHKQTLTTEAEVIWLIEGEAKVSSQRRDHRAWDLAH
ncbi:hypothetical protein FGADI_8325 [Fusarium gaditjirri]|uniref:Uncharacterized protein n=1 Tax=Fusarium gaditjirri TaxID=282569 RepID=A0A8H4WTZ5_9HYPO|nr:hypothetical protein FGADI_8325 [Fusarium gaditjirri]